MTRRTKSQRRREQRRRQAGLPVVHVPKTLRVSRGKDRESASSAPSLATPDGAPTPERMAQDDAGIHLARSPLQEKLRGGRETRCYRAPPPIERMRNECKLDHDETMNEDMYQQALQLEALARKAGMSAVAAQDLTRVFGGGSNNDPTYMTPRTATAATARGDLNQRLNFIGLKIERPLYGNARVCYAVCVEEISFAAAGRLHCGALGADKTCAAVAKDRLRQGLMALVDLSRMRQRPPLSRVLGGLLKTATLAAALAVGVHATTRPLPARPPLMRKLAIASTVAPSQMADVVADQPS